VWWWVCGVVVGLWCGGGFVVWWWFIKKHTQRFEMRVQILTIHIRPTETGEIFPSRISERVLKGSA
jgi:hypothetical protein